MDKKKNIILGILLFCMIMLFLPTDPAFADAGGELTAENGNVTVTLLKPQEEPEPVTALRFWLAVSILEGQTGQPSFTFSEDILNMKQPDGVCSAKVTGQDGGYLVDVMIALKKNHDIFAGQNQSVIGTLHLQPASQPYRIQTAFAGAPSADSGQPVIRYISSAGQSVQAVPLTDAPPAVSTNISQNPSVPNVPGYPVTPDVPGYPVTPDMPGYPTAPDMPGYPTAPGDTDSTQEPEAPKPPSETPDQTQGSSDTDAFNKKTSPKLRVTVKNKSSKVSFSWDPIAGADGYQIYCYEGEPKKYTRIKTIADAKKTTYAKTMEYETPYTFRVRAFQTAKDGSRIYGIFSKSVTVTTAPAKVTKLSVKQKKSLKAVLTWNPGDTADDYQIYRATKKKGTYIRIKTLKNGKAGKYFGISQKRGQTYYYKVRAYVVQADGTRTYGSFSGAKKLAVR